MSPIALKFHGDQKREIISFADGPQVANVMYGLVEHLFEHNHSGR
jgi:hypothetical protein